MLWLVQVFGPGPITLEDLVRLCPTVEAVCKRTMSGAQLLGILEAGVAQYPACHAHFPQVRWWAQPCRCTH